MVLAKGGPVSDEDAVMTVKEVSVYLRLAESTVYKLAQEGQLPGRKVGGAWRFSRKGIEGWLGERPSTKEASIIETD